MTEPTEPDAASEPAQAAGNPPEDEPTPTRWSRRTTLIVTAVAAIVAVLGVTAAAVVMWLPSSVDPAERMPASVIGYVDVNLDPSFDQTPQLLSLVKRLSAEDDELGADSIIADLLAEAGVEGIDVDEHLTSWLGTRGALAFWPGGTDVGYFVLALASRDDDAAERGLAAIHDTGEFNFSYVVDDGLAMLAYGMGDPDGVATTIATEGRAAPLADKPAFAGDIDRFDADQLVTIWIDIDAMAETTRTVWSYYGIDEADDPSDLFEGGTVAAGLRVADDGVEIRYVVADSPMAATVPDWRDQLGALRGDWLGAFVQLPDLAEYYDEIVQTDDQLYADVLDGADDFYRGMWDYEFALTDDEAAEFDELYERWSLDEIGEGDPEFDRLIELEEIWWLYGFQADYNEWVAAGGESAEQWAYEQSLTVDEYHLFVHLSDLAEAGALAEEDEELYYELDIRMFRYGVEADYDGHDDFFGDLRHLLDVISEARIKLALGTLSDEDWSIDASIELAGDAADALLDVPLPDELADFLHVNGSTATLSYPDVGGASLSDHPLFDTAFAGAPDAANFALFMDLAELFEFAASDDDVPDALARISAFSWVNGEDSGLIRIVVD